MQLDREISKIWLKEVTMEPQENVKDWLRVTYAQKKNLELTGHFGNLIMKLREEARENVYARGRWTMTVGWQDSPDALV